MCRATAIKKKMKSHHLHEYVKLLLQEVVCTSGMGEIQQYDGAVIA
jgi:hypothetical protein